MTDRETFFPNDTPILVYEARRPDIHRSDDFDGIPAQPDDVWMQIFSGTDGTLLEIDGSTTIPLGPEGTYLYMSAMDETEDRGAYIYVRVPEDMSANPGNYTLYITSEYADGMRITHSQRIQISEYR
jgi:hypothetical protein